MASPVSEAIRNAKALEDLTATLGDLALKLDTLTAMVAELLAANAAPAAKADKQAKPKA